MSHCGCLRPAWLNDEWAIEKCRWIGYKLRGWNNNNGSSYCLCSGRKRDDLTLEKMTATSQLKIVIHQLLFNRWVTISFPRTQITSTFVSPLTFLSLFHTARIFFAGKSVVYFYSPATNTAQHKVYQFTAQHWTDSALNYHHYNSFNDTVCRHLFLLLLLQRRRRLSSLPGEENLQTQVDKRWASPLLLWTAEQRSNKKKNTKRRRRGCTKRCNAIGFVVTIG